MDNTNHEILPQPQPRGESTPGKVPPEQQAPPRVNSEHEQQSVQAIEAGISKSSGSAAGQSYQPVSTDSSAQSSQVDVGQQQAMMGSQFAHDTPAIADDIDLIEKEWVNKAKQIVEDTKHDPYNQNKEIVRLRADYMKKRYNKDIKLQKD